MHDILVRQRAAGVLATRDRHIDNMGIVEGEPDLRARRGRGAGADRDLAPLETHARARGPAIGFLRAIASISETSAPTPSARPLTTICGV